VIKPLTEEERKAALRDGIAATLEEASRREPELRQLRETAKKTFYALLSAPTWDVTQAPLPEGATPQPVDENWTVTTKVTVQE
jgi:hypothetical protein